MTGEHASNRGLWIGVVLGTPVVAYGVAGVFDALPGVQLTSFARWFVGGALVHDLLLAPAVCAVGWVLARYVPGRARAPAQAALIASGVVTLVAWPFIRGDGVTAGEPSFLSRDYETSLLVVLGVVWGATLLVIAAGALADRLSARRR